VLPEPLRVTLLVIDALEALDVPYALGGSMASSIHGVARSTNDSDLVADLQPRHVKPFLRELGEAFYADERAIQEAIRRRSSFNLIHLETMFKVDIFIPKTSKFERAQIAHRQAFPLAADIERKIYVTSPEDTILAKLLWYKMGGEISERQWRDVLGILEVQGDRLDMSYLRRSAEHLGVRSLLEKAVKQI